jgi:hypothetical protein
MIKTNIAENPNKEAMKLASCKCVSIPYIKENILDA